MTQIRLIIAAALAIVFLSVGGLALWYRSNAFAAEAERDRARADLATAVDVNRAQEATIGRMRAQADADAKGAAELAAELAALNDAFRANNAALAELKDKDATVRDYLNTPVPDDVRRMYAPR
ncbi:hypothetical protein [Aminobacter aminovorans]|uniref:LysB family phage lysis regulatory protein n=1 Tax=Aminobacter aminovorans TaxID=83263 RepID=A0ABR6H5T4_AMIAI|nr:hypothetical protein [Aminobacter aminovorans]MBB3705876.1 LysB family phage lysis regulatory protein [Aminobacter aminovorans]